MVGPSSGCKPDPFGHEVRFPPRPTNFRSLAQRQEQLALNQLVQGSNPWRPTTFRPEASRRQADTCVILKDFLSTDVAERHTQLPQKQPPSWHESSSLSIGTNSVSSAKQPDCSVKALHSWRDTNTTLQYHVVPERPWARLQSVSKVVQLHSTCPASGCKSAVRRPPSEGGGRRCKSFHPDQIVGRRAIRRAANQYRGVPPPGAA